ncbi:hypothetical protein PCASD_08058 [Puccinia coronata f. sp. avenae]|uniref:Secreted protein n=1 Tax=Puccinia coronata f. sp. avenae TaxID=200324 RepID=A0A2N5UZG5_9BASI|nr:hypothetical protein PCASD_08058 [Puccinia coronata f. sp. avenae]
MGSMLFERIFRGTFLLSLVLVHLVNSVSVEHEHQEFQGPMLARRANNPPPPALKNGDAAGGIVQCGNSLGTRNPKDQPLWVSCRDYGWKSWYCPIANCQVVNPRDTSSATSLKAYTFEHCEVYPKTNQSTTDATISVQSFFAHNGHGVSVVKSTPTKESPHKVHVCRFQDRNSMNNVRPWCSGCVYWEWDEVDWTPLLSKPV